MMRSLRLLLVSASLMSLTACMGVRQLNELAIVTAVGLDLGEKPGTTRLSVQIIRPADARGQTGAPSGGTGDPIYTISAEGSSIFQAIRNLGRISSRRVYWAHNFLIVMREEYARKGLEDMVDFFTRNHELRMNTWVAVTPDKPEEVISTVTGLEVVPGSAVDRLFRDNHIAGQASGSNMMNLEEAYLSRSTSPLLAKLQLASRGVSNKKPGEHGSFKQVELAGAAAFKDGKMAGWLNVQETQGSLFFLESLESGILPVDCPNKKGKVTLEYKRARLTIDTQIRNGRPRYAIRLKAEADIVENGCKMNLAGSKREIEKELAAVLQSEIESVLDKAQHQYRSDFLKLGETFRNKYPVEWHQVRGKWDTVFAEAETSVHVQTVIVSTVVKAAGDRIR
ncbi:spore germination protein KC [Paenibacillus sp. UNC496MF]|uniref:Ger(x)C family spore germination protein n=1 Tax=Paenibacillus sp. UNC496MF TaxID=1502753 RepID=UPI0008F1205C|nr:Ger(x)C family spore germination protein [Paenibacillus sp. UNC496MF]SFJ30528.1 spore germination protein KC [Paenibacillus sp. UNC496MF]